MTFSPTPASRLRKLDEFSMVNRLIIIGNGFDLAHGLKSSFKDFIDDYFLTAVTTFLKEDTYEDDLLKVLCSRRIKDSERLISQLKLGKALKELKGYLSNSSEIEIEWKSKFFQKIV